MKSVLLVALREVRQVTGTRGFWIMLLAVPLALAISIFASSRLAPERSSAYTIVDRSGASRLLAKTEMASASGTASNMIQKPRVPVTWRTSRSATRRTFFIGRSPVRRRRSE